VVAAAAQPYTTVLQGVSQLGGNARGLPDRGGVGDIS
jgi:hypothetical protein